MAEFHLIRPWVLLGLVLLPALAWWLRQQAQSGHYWQKLLPAHLHQAMLLGADSSRPQSTRLPIGLLALLLFALSGPSWDKQSVPLFQLQQGRVLVMDMSYSQWATDLAPNRLTHTRFKALDLLEQIPDGEMGLVVYGGDAFTLAPLTDDRSTLANLIPVLSPDLIPVPGSNLPKALYQADQLLRDAGYSQGEILLLIDGLHSEHANEAIELANKMPWTLNLLVIGTAEGAPMEKPGGELVRSRNGEIALAVTDYATLGKLARAGDGILVPYQPDGSDVRQLAPRADALRDEGQQHDNRQHSQWLDRGVYLLPLLLLPLAWMLRRHALLTLLLLPLLTPKAEAGFWQTGDQQGQAAFDEQQFEHAAAQFSDPAWQGAAHYRAGEFEQALAAFERSEALDSRYNSGNALAQLGQYQQAAERYRQVLEQQPEHPQAQANLALMEQLLEQQEQDAQSDQGEGEGEGDSQQQDTPSDQGSQSENGDPSEQQAPQEPNEGEPSPSDPSQSSGSQSSDASSQQDAGSEAEQGSSEPQAEQPEPATDSAGQSNDNEREPEQTPSQPSEPTQEEANAEAQVEPQSEPSAGDQQPDASTAAGAAQPGESGSDPELERMLQLVPDDPGQLLRNKMQLEYQRRRQEGTINTERTQW
ncbi:VWA domain-containing protein [Ferrimonas pelagia]|uniref:VWA domain-containing protein n=1 Tax=Ferrimonas pelagia TaxID=1177826 RepID=A0ABP9E9Q9_9GAMM